MSPLPQILSPCDHVRRSCYSLMENDQSGNLVKIRTDILHQWVDGTLIPSLTNTATAATTTTAHPSSSCDSDITVSSWDDQEWHYTGKNYHRPWLSIQEQVQQRYERIALYILTLDCINFCFWPVTRLDTNVNLFEYEHFAKALNILAQEDDILLNDDSTKERRFPLNNHGEYYTVAEDSYALAPHRISSHLLDRFCNVLLSMTPASDTTSSITHISEDDSTKETIQTLIPMMKQRWIVWQEIMYTLTHQFHGSATYFISQAHQSADYLVYHIISAFTAFRDTAIDGYTGQIIAFYKRAQIMVGDLWAALQGPPKDMAGIQYNHQSSWYTYCDFYDIDQLTTFADYRIPQLFHSLNIFEYSSILKSKILEKEILWPGSVEELTIRAATIVVVDQIVTRVRDYFSRIRVPSLEEEKDKYRIKNINAVTMDWYLWNLGETLDRQGALYPHHRIRTLYY